MDSNPSPLPNDAFDPADESVGDPMCDAMGDARGDATRDPARLLGAEVVARHEARVALLGRLAAYGERLVEKAMQQAEDATWLRAEGMAIFESLIKAIRTTVAVQATLDERFEAMLRRAARPAPEPAGDRGRDAGARAAGPRPAGVSDPGARGPMAPAAPRDPAARRAMQRDKERVRVTVEGAIDQDALQRDADPRYAARLRRELYAVLADPSIEQQLANRPIGHVIAEICQVFGIRVDLEAFTDEEIGYAEVAKALGLPSDAEQQAAYAGMPKLPTGVIGTPGVPTAAAARQAWLEQQEALKRKPPD